MLEKVFVLYNSLTNSWITIPTCNILLYITVITIFKLTIKLPNYRIYCFIFVGICNSNTPSRKIVGYNKFTALSGSAY